VITSSTIAAGAGVYSEVPERLREDKMPTAVLKFKGKPAKIEKSKTNSRMYVLWVKNNKGKYEKENVSTSKRHLVGICRFS
jgi:hypothetical protein